MTLSLHHQELPLPTSQRLSNHSLFFRMVVINSFQNLKNRHSLFSKPHLFFSSLLSPRTWHRLLTDTGPCITPLSPLGYISQKDTLINTGLWERGLEARKVDVTQNG